MATITDTWDSSFEASPAGSDQFSVVDNRIRQVKRAVSERLQREHKFTPGTDNSLHGIHLEGSARVWYGGSTPTARPDGDAITTNDAGRIYWPSAGNILVYTGSAWTSLASLSVGGDISCTGSLKIGDGSNVGITSDTDLMRLTSGTVTVNGDLDATGQLYAASSLKVGSSGSTITQITVS